MKHNPTLDTLIAGLAPLEVRLAPGASSLRPTALTADSRQAGAGSLFVAVPGTKVDGHSFIPQVVAAGAAAVVCEHIPDGASADVSWIRVADSSEALGLLASAWHGHPSRRLTLVGVTGKIGRAHV